MREPAIENRKSVGDLADNVALLAARLDCSEHAFHPVTVGDFVRFDNNEAGAAAADSRQAG